MNDPTLEQRLQELEARHDDAVGIARSLKSKADRLQQRLDAAAVPPTVPEHRQNRTVAIDPEATRRHERLSPAQRDLLEHVAMPRSRQIAMQVRV